MKPVLVGMNNPYGADPYYALYPLPENSGELLARLHNEYRAGLGCV